MTLSSDEHISIRSLIGIAEIEIYCSERGHSFSYQTLKEVQVNISGGSASYLPL